MITPPTTKMRLARRGFTMVEALITLSITAMLMLAMGSAFTAAGGTIEANDRFFRSVQQARVAMDLITKEIRRCSAVTAESSTSVTITCASTDFSGDSITYAYSSGQLTMTDNTAGTAAVVLASNVTSASFDATTGNTIIALTLTVQIGPTPVTLCGSAAPRYLMSSSAYN